MLLFLPWARSRGYYCLSILMHNLCQIWSECPQCAFFPSSNEIHIQEVPVLDYQAGTMKRTTICQDFSVLFFFSQKQSEFVKREHFDRILLCLL